eukprot:SAG31_NODE_13147_length_890_cov_1.007585_1_plen_150_part_01
MPECLHEGTTVTQNSRWKGLSVSPETALRHRVLASASPDQEPFTPFTPVSPGLWADKDERWRAVEQSAATPAAHAETPAAHVETPAAHAETTPAKTIHIDTPSADVFAEESTRSGPLRGKRRGFNNWHNRLLWVAVELVGCPVRVQVTGD